MKWIQRVNDINVNLYSVTNIHDDFVTVGANGTIARLDIYGRPKYQINITNEILWGVTADNNTDILVAVGDNGTIIRSEDGGENWVEISSNITKNLYSIKYYNEFTIVGQDGLIATSFDGIDWTIQDSGTTDNLYGINSIEDGVCVIVGANGTILTGSNEYWNLLSNTTSNDLYGAYLEIEYNPWPNSHIIVVGTNGTILRQLSESIWEDIDSGISNQFNDATKAYLNNTTYIIVGADGIILTSLDNITWTKEETSTNNILEHIAKNDERNSIVVVGHGGTILSYVEEEIDTQTYFFNDQYDDMIVHDAIFEYKNKLYQRSLESQSSVIGMKHYSIPKESFRIDNTLNSKYGIPTNTRTTLITDWNVIPYYNRKKYIDTFGFDNRVALKEIWYNSSMFSKRIVVYNGNLQTMKVSFILTKSEGIIICADFWDSGTNTMIADVIDFLYTTQSDVYYTRKTKAEIFNGNKILLSKFIDNKTFVKNESNNAYKISIGDEIFLESSNCKIVNDVGGDYFEVPIEFVNKISPGVHSCYIYHDAYKEGIITFTKQEGFSPIFQIPFDENIVPINNIMVYEMYDDNVKLGRPLNTNTIISYPNIYIFDDNVFDNDKKYIIEWYNITSDNTGIIFDNNVKDYIKYIGSDYAEKYLNHELPQSLIAYKPMTNFVYDYDDYYSYNTTNIRGYKLSKMQDLLMENSLRYNSFFKKFTNRNRRYIHMSTNGILTPEIMSRTVTELITNYLYDNSNESTIYYSEDITHTFDEPQTYVLFSNSTNIPRGAQVFLDGYRVLPTLIHTNHFETRVYLPKSIIDENTNIVIDLFFAHTDYDKGKIEDIMTIYSENTPHSLPNPELFGKLSGSDFMFYHELSRKDIYDEIEMGLRVNEYTFIRGDYKEKFVVNIDDKSYLVTILEEYYRTSEWEKVLLSKNDKVIMSNTKEFYKKIDVKNLIVSGYDPNVINTEIGVTNTNNYRIKYAENTTQGQIFTITNFRDERNPDRFRVFYGGKLLQASAYAITFDEWYGETVQIQLSSLPPTNDTSLIIEYIPFREETIFEGILPVNRYKNGGLIDLSHYTNKSLDLESTRIYLDGLRVSNLNIRQFNTNDMIYIREYKPQMHIRVDVLCHDDEPYGFRWFADEIDPEYPDDPILLINNLITNDIGFGEYLHTNDINLQNFPTSNITKIKYLNNKLFIIGDTNTSTGKYFIASSDNGVQWYMNDDIEGSSRLNDITFGNNVYVIVGNNGTILTSIDGSFWNKMDSGIVANISSVIYFNSKYYLCTHNGVIYESISGVTWNPIFSLGENTTISSICILDGSVVITGAGNINQIKISTNMVDWNNISGTTDIITSMTAGKSNIIGIGSSKLVKIFKNKTVVTNIDIPEDIDQIARISYSHGYFMLGYNNKIVLIKDSPLTQSDSGDISHMEIPLPEKNVMNGIIYTDKILASINDTGELLQIPVFN